MKSYDKWLWIVAREETGIDAGLMERFCSEAGRVTPLMLIVLRPPRSGQGSSGRSVCIISLDRAEPLQIDVNVLPSLLVAWVRHQI